jgi:Leucine-rich repeat (LRR) protein
MSIPTDSEVKRKYIVYKNDLKYKKYRDLNVKDIEFANKDVEALFHNEDLDTADYRLAECIKEKGISLDFKNLDLAVLPVIPDVLFKSLKHLFIGDNDLTEIPDLDKFVNLEVIDVSHNKLTKINKLPSALIELNCASNLITELDMTYLKNLERIDCSGNNIIEINEFTKLKVLNCNNNKLNKITGMQQLEVLKCSTNELTKINSFPNLKYLDCRENKVQQVKTYPLLRELICSNNTIREIGIYPELIFLEFFNTKLEKLHFMSKLKEIMCDIEQYKNLKCSNKYQIESTRIHKEKHIDILFKVHKE